MGLEQPVVEHLASVERAARIANHHAAVLHVQRGQDTPAVQSLLSSAGSKNLLGSSRRFPGLMLLVAALVRSGKDDATSLALLFGGRDRVGDLLLQVRHDMQHAQPGSPVDLMGCGPSTEHAVARSERVTCARDGCCNAGVKQCTGCRAAYYCSQVGRIACHVH